MKQNPSIPHLFQTINKAVMRLSLEQRYMIQTNTMNQQKYCTTTPWKKLLVIFAVATSSTEAFAPHRPSSTPRVSFTHVGTTYQRRNASLELFPKFLESLTALDMTNKSVNPSPSNAFSISLLLGSVAAPLAGLTTAGSSVPPTLEAEVLTDLSHVSLDLASLFLGSGVLVLRLAAVLGRLCSIGADYLPDHKMLPEEMIFQSFMLLLAFGGLVQSVLPSILASMNKNNCTGWQSFSRVVCTGWIIMDSI